MPVRRVLPLTLLALGSWILGGVGQAADAAPGPSLSVPVTVVNGLGGVHGARPVVQVAVGRSSPRPMLLDTGSVGLHLFAPAIKTGPGSGITITKQPDMITYTSGSVLHGFVAYATIRIGAAVTPRAVAFGLMEQGSCSASKPNCPVAGGLRATVARGSYGIVGVGMGASSYGVVSPILGLTSPLGSRWAVHVTGGSGTLLLGAPTPPASSVVATMHLPSQGRTPGGQPLWDDKAMPFCVAVSGGTPVCAAGVFDTGTTVMQLRGGAFSNVPVDRNSLVRPGTTLALSVSATDAPYWTFTVGTTRSSDTAHVAAQKVDFVNTGIQAFYAFTVTYDATDGTVEVSR